MKKYVSSSISSATIRTLFGKGRLPPLWNTLFSILNRALTCKTGSPDQSSHQILAIMYAIYYDLPLDYAGLIFDEMVNAVKAKVKEQTGSKKTKKEGKNPKTSPIQGSSLYYLEMISLEKLKQRENLF